MLRNHFNDYAQDHICSTCGTAILPVEHLCEDCWEGAACPQGMHR